MTHDSVRVKICILHLFIIASTLNALLFISYLSGLTLQNLGCLPEFFFFLNRIVELNPVVQIAHKF